MRVYHILFFIFSFSVLNMSFKPAELKIDVNQYQLPVLKQKENNPVLRIKITSDKDGETITQLHFTTLGTSDLKDINSVRLFFYGKDSMPGNMDNRKRLPLAVLKNIKKEIIFTGEQKLQKGENYFWLSYELSSDASLLNFVDAGLLSVTIDGKRTKLSGKENKIKQRIGVAVRKHKQDNVHTSRIPGLATTNKGTLIAIFDARYESARDLQGHIDIGIHRSEDGGNTWKPLQIVMDMNEWGGLPQKFNGVSDACILVDKKSSDIYIAGLWMHGVINEDGKWIENLTEQSDAWNHQWRNKASQPGYSVNETSQFLVVKSSDDGETWSMPENITKMGKKRNWWLWAPAPGQGITLKDGTLVFPTQGRDENGKPFSNITFSADGGKTWKASNAAINESTTECMAVELTDGSIMLNMRANSNKGNTGPTNGRAIAITKDLGKTWKEHPSSHSALPEPVCMGSIHRHDFEKSHKKQSILLFSNPDSKIKRHRLSIKISDDDGMSWNRYQPILLDEWNSRGYSCLTSIDEHTVGILYESSQADMVFQAVPVKELLKK